MDKHLKYLTVAIVLLSISGCGSPEERANKEASEAGLMMTTLSSIKTPEEMINLQDDILEKLNGIVHKYPSSSLAIKILNGEPVAGIHVGFLTEKNKNDKQAFLHQTCRDYGIFRKENKQVCDAVSNLLSNFDSFAKAAKAMGVPFTDYTKINKDKDVVVVRPFIDRRIDQWGIPKTPKDPSIPPITLD